MDALPCAGWRLWSAVASVKGGGLYTFYQRWSPRGRPGPRGRPRGHILKSLALASKIALSSARGQHYF